jgi:hypothetical protein
VDQHLDGPEDVVAKLILIFLSRDHLHVAFQVKDVSTSTEVPVESFTSEARMKRNETRGVCLSRLPRPRTYVVILREAPIVDRQQIFVQHEATTWTTHVPGEKLP